MNSTKLSSLCFLVCILSSAACTSSKDKSSETSQVSEVIVYPESDEIAYADYMKILGNPASFQRRAVAQAPAALPKDYKAGKIFSVITDPAILQQLERKGVNFPSHLDVGFVPEINNADLLNRSKQYTSMVEVLSTGVCSLAVCRRFSVRADGYSLSANRTGQMFT